MVHDEVGAHVVLGDAVRGGRGLHDDVDAHVVLGGTVSRPRVT